ncbi:MFS transporter [Actinophytocola sp.]|uniref:MFS transporter n=1 Tax=Actinophytocola sp. TaxID=1872138 RepID=UPI002ED937FC
MTTTVQTRAGRGEHIGLAVLALPTILVALDLSVLYLALPHVAADLGASGVQQLWITDIYGFLVAGLLVTMGTLGDRIGRRRLLMIGAACFTVASILAAYSTSPALLIASRALLGVAGSTMVPSTMALIGVMFTDPRQHARAITVWMCCFMGGAALGPVVGGVLLEHFWWGSVFLMGVPVMLLLLVLGPRALPEQRDPAAGRLDLPSVGLSLAAVLPFVYGLKSLSRNGFDVFAALAVLVGTGCAVAFVRRQRRLASPLLDLRLFGNRTFSTALTMTVFAGLIAANQLFVSMYLQSVVGLSPAAAGLWLLPSTVAMVVSMQFGPMLARLMPVPVVIAGGLVVSAVGFLTLTQVSGGGLTTLVAGLVVANLGLGPMAGLCTVLAMQSAPPERAGSAGALASTAGELGLAMGVAVIGMIGTALYSGGVAVPAGVPAAAADTARESVTGALAVAESLSPVDGERLVGSAFDAITASMHASAAICAGLVLLAGALTVFGLRGQR